MRVAIIGAGAAGLSSARHVSANGHDCDIFEISPELGGTWFYTDDVGTDKFGFPVYSAMYKGLRTNLPKEVMGFPDFAIPEQQKSYLTQTEIWEFLNLYADHFKLKPFIKFNTMVINVRPLPDRRWEVRSTFKPTKTETIGIYDAVMVCNGHYNDPVMPKLKGHEKFKGRIEHSRNYRSPDEFSGKKVLVIGGGPSGLDLTLHISTVANQVVLSHHSSEPINTAYPSNVQLKPDVAHIKNKDEIEFVDGSCCCFDTIILCTGYNYSFPFLDKSCGVTVEDNYIQPLFQHMLLIANPTLCFIGIPFNVCAFQMFDLQARYFCKFISGDMPLPATDYMRMHTERDMQARWAKGYTKRQAHHMGPDQRSYYEVLAKEANIKPIEPVIVKLRDHSVKRLYDDLINFRDDRYKIVDADNYVKVH